MNKRILIIVLIIGCILLSSCTEIAPTPLVNDPLIEVLGANYTEIDKINYVYELVSDLRSISFHMANVMSYDGGTLAFCNLALEFLELGYELYNGNWQQAISL